MTAQLIDATDGSHLWSERYDRELTDVFAVQQDEIAASIASALHLKLTPQPASAERYKPNVPAYEAYLKGRHYSYKITADSMPVRRSILSTPSHSILSSRFRIASWRVFVFPLRAGAADRPPNKCRSFRKWRKEGWISIQTWQKRIAAWA